VPVARTLQSPGVEVGSNTVLVSAETWSAHALPCPDWSKTGGVYDGLNLPSRNLGCATARNIADMVDNPRDLAVGRTPGPASGQLGASAVDRLYSDKVKGSQAPSGGGSSGGGTSPSTGTN
jgi:type IV pilus biogenesis protein CpaD/CtpE